MICATSGIIFPVLILKWMKRNNYQHGFASPVKQVSNHIIQDKVQKSQIKPEAMKNEVENLKNDFTILKDKQDKAAILKKDKEHSQEKCEQTND